MSRALPYYKAMIHDYPSAFPYLTLYHLHSDACCGLDDFGKPSFICGYPLNACTTCQVMGASAADMAVCVAARTKKMQAAGLPVRRSFAGDVF